MKAYEFSINELKPASEIKEPIAKDEMKSAIESLAFKNIFFQYAEQPVLADLSFEINKGDFIGITGESGKGKTSILNIILGFLPAEKGEITINGEIVDSNELKIYWPGIAYVRQQNFFIHDTLLRNITLEEEAANNRNLQQAIDHSGLEKIIEQFPEGLEKIITENGKNISGGQQQRIAIARTLYKDARLILLDEPFNELDEEATYSLLNHFRELAAAGKMIVMITHDKKSLSYCNKTISLDK
jgi:ABC-type bacteriocin/lantibiotic exporter with double-glycine peptidase domain